VLFYVLFCDVPCIVCVYMCTEQLPPGGYPIAVKYVIPYHIISYHIISYHIISYHTEGSNQPVTPSRNDSGLCSGGVRFKISALALIIHIGFCDLPGSVETNTRHVHYIRITQIKKLIQIIIILKHSLYLHHLHRLTGYMFHIVKSFLKTATRLSLIWML